MTVLGATFNGFPGTLLGPSGGLLWHWRAVTGRRRTAATRRAVAQWLDNWRPPCTELIVVGPSAGWMLPGEFLQRFRTLIAFDLDPSARWLFAMRHGTRLRRHGVQWCWNRQDFTANLQQALQAHPNAAVLFCNVLGQLSLERDDHSQVLAAIPGQLGAHHWASIHDVYSGHVDLSRLPLRPVFTLTRPLIPDDLRRLGCSGTWHDHGTSGLFAYGVCRTFLPWMITATRMHWLEAGAVAPNTTASAGHP